MGGVGYVATTIDRPGVIRQTGPMQRLLFGEFDGSATERGKSFLASCLAGGINAELSPNIEREIWQKYVFLVGLSGTTTTIRKTIGPIRENAQTRAFLLDVMREVVAVGRAQGVDLPEDYAEIRLKLADDVALERADAAQSGHCGHPGLACVRQARLSAEGTIMQIDGSCHCGAITFTADIDESRALAATVLTARSSRVLRSALSW
jgi:hypothetical protein